MIDYIYFCIKNGPIFIKGHRDTMRWHTLLQKFSGASEKYSRRASGLMPSLSRRINSVIAVVGVC